MADAPNPPASSKFASKPGVNWAAGLAAAVVLGHILGLIVVGITNEWVLWIVLGIIGVVLAAAVGFAVRLTSATGGAFWPALIAGGLAAHIPSTLGGVGFDDLGYGLLGVYQSAPFAAYVVFVGLAAALVATFGRKA